MENTPSITAGKPLRVLVTGANGQLGKELKRLESAHPECDFRFLSREDLPIHHFELVRHFFTALKPDVLINCAAYTAVDRAEEERELAYQVNAEAVGVLAAVCKEHHTRFIHISTDYVFDGEAKEPYAVDAPTNPQSVYGLSKREGENQALQLNPDTVIIRTSWVYSSFGKNFVKTMLRLFAERPVVGVVTDQWGSPTYAADLAEAILEIAKSPEWHPGIYHYCNEGVINWFQFAVAIKELTGSASEVKPITTADYPTPARRPAWSALDTSLIQQVYRIRSKPWKESLEKCLQQLK